LALLVAACASIDDGQVLTVAELEQLHPNTNLLGIGDRVRIGLYEDAAFNGDYEVGSDNTISLPLIGTLTAAGLTLSELRTAIESALAQGFYQNPRISIQLITVPQIYVLGEVNHAGAFPYAPDMTLGKAAALAGGYSYRARQDIFALRRAHGEVEILVKADQAMLLAPGDTIRMLERRF
jgi:polysaccharide export outer membrane protein